MSQLLIRQIIETRLAAAAALRDVAVKYQNMHFDPPNRERPEDNVYVAAYQLPAETRADDLAGEMTTYSGVYQFSVVSPRDVGTKLVGELVAWLSALFPNNLQLQHDSGLELQIISPLSEAVAIEGDTDYTISTSFRYRSL